MCVLTISEAVAAHFLGLDHVAVAGLMPFIEGAGRKLAGSRAVPITRRDSIASVFEKLAEHCKEDTIFATTLALSAKYSQRWTLLSNLRFVAQRVLRRIDIEILRISSIDLVVCARTDGGLWALSSSLCSRSVPMYSARKSSSTWALGVRRAGREKSAQRCGGGPLPGGTCMSITQKRFIGVFFPRTGQ